MKTKEKEMLEAKTALRSAGIDFEQLDTWHLRIKMGGQVVDYWPTTGSWLRPDSRMKARYISLDSLVRMARNVEAAYATQSAD